MKAILAMASNGCIGKDNKIPWHLPEDLKFFKKMTLNKTVIMGRNTYESILGYLGKPLPNRNTVVLSSTLEDDRVTVIRDSKDLPTGDDCFIIGGVSLYLEWLDKCTDVYVTHVYEPYDGDTFLNWKSKHEYFSVLEGYPEFYIAHYHN